MVMGQCTKARRIVEGRGTGKECRRGRMALSMLGSGREVRYMVRANLNRLMVTCTRVNLGRALPMVLVCTTTPAERCLRVIWWMTRSTDMAKKCRLQVTSMKGTLRTICERAEAGSE